MLNTTATTVTLGDNTTDTVTVTIKNTKPKTPSTGGPGTGLTETYVVPEGTYYIQSVLFNATYIYSGDKS